MNAEDFLFEQLQIVDETVSYGLDDEARWTALWRLRDGMLRLPSEDMDGVPTNRRRYSRKLLVGHP